jgi:hypothetical protein
MTDESIIDWANILAAMTVDDERAKQREREWVASHVDEWWGEARKNLPAWKFARFGNQVWESRCDPKLLAVVKSWVPMTLSDGKLVPQGMLLCAPSGAGKSTAVLARLYETASRLRRASLDGRSTVRYPPGLMWVSEQQLMTAQDERHAQLLNEARSVSLLVLDEFGFAGGHDAARGRTPIGLDILSNRYDQQLATVVTSGMSVAQLAKRYGVAITRRMQDGAKVVDMLAGARP